MSGLKPYWVGVRASDIDGVEGLFGGGISAIGEFSPSMPMTFSVEKKIGRRINHNNSKNYEIVESEIAGEIAAIRKNHSDAIFFFQDQLSFSSSCDLRSVATCLNHRATIAALNDKIRCRSAIGRHVPTVGATLIFRAELTDELLRSMFPSVRRFVVQEPIGAGGYGTLLLDGGQALHHVQALDACQILISAFVENSLPVNQHLVVFPQRTVVLPPSAQIITSSNGGRMLYSGCDFFTTNYLDDEIRRKIDEYGQRIGDVLRTIGYRGVAGIDYVVTKDDVLFVEINPRFQASTLMLNKNLIENDLPSVHAMHIAAFAGHPTPELPHNIPVRGALFRLLQKEGLRIPTALSRPPAGCSTICIDLEGLGADVPVEYGANLGKVMSDRQILHYEPGSDPILNPIFRQFITEGPGLLHAVESGDSNAIRDLAVQLTDYGVRLERSAHDRLLGAAVTSGGLTVKLADDVRIPAATQGYFIPLSPYSITWDQAASVFRLHDGGSSVVVEIMADPAFG